MSSALRCFQPGERIAIREVRAGCVWTSRPVTVVHDSADQFVSYLDPGTIIDYPVGVEHGRRTFAMWLSGEWKLAGREFLAPGMLRIAPSGQPFEVFAPWSAERGVLSWYVNFQEPLTRTPSGFETMDETLDLEVTADLSSWRRKDEDELELAMEMGVYSDADAQRIRAACLAVESGLRSGAVPWDLSWRDWRPPEPGSNPPAT